MRQIGFHPEKDCFTIMAASIPPLWYFGKAYCVTIIWHPNIDSTLPPGRENFHLGENWNPKATLSELIMGIKKLVHLNSEVLDLEHSLNLEAKEQYVNNRDEFESKARTWTRRYALED